MVSLERNFWKYGLFQIPAIFLGIVLLIAIIVSILTLPCTQFWQQLTWALVGISLAWTLVLPLDRLLKAKTQLPMNLTGRIALGNALFWSALIVVLMASILPPLWQLCSVIAPVDASELVSLDWSRWRADVWNEMFHEQPNPAPTGSEAEFSFTVSSDRKIENIEVDASNPEMESLVTERINTLNDNTVLTFVPGTKRDQVRYESSVLICDEADCGQPADPADYPDTEKL